MARERIENPWVVVGACLMAVGGVMAIRLILGLDFRFWAAAYLAMALTASIRRTSEGSDCTTWSAIRGIGCLFLGLQVTYWMGYPENSFRTVALVPEEFLEAMRAVRAGIQNGH